MGEREREREKETWRCCSLVELKDKTVYQSITAACLFLCQQGEVPCAITHTCLFFFFSFLHHYIMLVKLENFAHEKQSFTPVDN